MDIPDISKIISGLTPLLTSGGVVGTIIFGWLMLRKNRFEEDNKIATFREKTLEDMIELVTKEQQGRREEEARANKNMRAARWWYNRCHKEQHDRNNVVQILMLLLVKHNIKVPTLPEPKDLPQLIEEADEGN